MSNCSYITRQKKTCQCEVWQVFRGRFGKTMCRASSIIFSARRQAASWGIVSAFGLNTVHEFTNIGTNEQTPMDSTSSICGRFYSWMVVCKFHFVVSTYISAKCSINRRWMKMYPPPTRRRKIRSTQWSRKGTSLHGRRLLCARMKRRV